MDVLRTAKQLHENFDEWVTAGAAKGGHIEVLQWLRSVGCPWDDKVYLKKTCSFSCLF